MKFIYLTAFLCSLVVMGVVSAGNEEPVVSCCLEVSNNKIPLRNIKDYRIQNPPLCHLKAVRFTTVKNKYICSDLEDRWAKHAMCEVDRKKSNKQRAVGCRIIYPTSTISILTPVRTESTHISMSTTTPGPEKITSQITYSSDKVTNKLTTTAVVTTLSPVYREKEMSNDYKENDGPVVSCCLEVSDTRIPVKNIKDYRIQNSPVCPLKAVVFITVKNIHICSDLEDSWAKHAMREVDRKKSNKQPAVGCRKIYPTSTISILKPTMKTTVKEPSTTTSSLPMTLTTNRGGLSSPLPIDVKGNTISKTTDKIQNVSGEKNQRIKNIMKKKRGKSKKQLHKFKIMKVKRPFEIKISLGPS